MYLPNYRFGHNDHIEHNQEVRSATARLFNEIIPRVAKLLDEMEPTRVQSDVNQRAASLEATLHREGVNCRHMGAVRKHVSSPLWSNVLLLEIVARHLKNQVKKKWREQLIEVGLP